MKKRRIDLVPKECSRCGNDLMTGSAIIHLPFEKRYICFCGVCWLGLTSNNIYSSNIPTDEAWNKFWGIKPKVNKKKKKNENNK